MTISRKVRCLTQEINPTQVSGEESMALLGQLSNLQQGVDDSLRKLTQLKYPARCQ